MGFNSGFKELICISPLLTVLLRNITNVTLPSLLETARIAKVCTIQEGVGRQ